MNKTNLLLKLLALFGMISLLSSSWVGNGVGLVSAQDESGGGIAPLADNGSSLYYYVDGQQVNLTPSLDWVSVKFASMDVEEQDSVTGKFSATVAPLAGAREITHLGLTLLPLQDGLGVKNLIQGVNAMRGSSDDFLQVNPVYDYADVKMVVSDEFVAAFPSEMSMAQIEAINLAHGVELLEPIMAQENTFVLRVTAASPLDALAMANLYQESGSVLYSAPNFVRLSSQDIEPSQEKLNPIGPLYTPNDYYYYGGDQWYLNNTQQYGTWMTLDADIDAPEAWNITKGSSDIVIAIVDEGVDLAHVDLAGNMVSGYDATGLGSAGAPAGDGAHGTAVAGIAAAVSNNTIGIAGVCQLCKIMPIRIAYSDTEGDWVTTDVWISEAIAWAYTHGADVLNNSWGGGSASTLINTAINNAVTLGRGGLGSVVVAAAGNNNTATVIYPASQSNVIAVGALNMCDARKTATYDNCNGNESWWGSSYGTALDIAAAGVWLTTTDITGTAGYSDGTGTYPAEYTGYMNGTSGASPIVSGVAGLILSKNPNYAPAQVQTILQSTADDLNTPGRDDETGYGRVNAFRAVSLAEDPSPVDVNVGGVLKGSYEVLSAPSVTVSYPDLMDGPVKVLSTNSQPILTSQRTFYTNSFNEVMGYPVNQFTTEYWFPWYDQVGMQTWILVGNPSGTQTAYVDIYIGTDKTSYTIPPNGRVTPQFPGKMDGPVRVVSTSGAGTPVALPIFTSERSLYGSSFNEVMGYPANQFTTEYWFPWYDQIDLRTWILVGNPSGTQTAYVDIYIGADKASFTIPPNGRVTPQFPGKMDGPVRVVSTSGAGTPAALPIFTSERSLYGSSFNEVMGYPFTQFTTDYWFTWYQHNTGGMSTWLLVGNPSATQTAYVDITIGGGAASSFTIPPNGRITPQFNISNGPVHVASKTGAGTPTALPIFTSERSLYGPSFNEMMGYPADKLTNEYWFTWYDAFMTTELLISKP